MRILLVHNSYRLAGGEESAVRLTAETLRSRGHDVALYQRDSAEWDRSGSARRLAMAVGTIYSRQTAADIAAEIARFKPDVVHVHNIFPFVSPSVYLAAGKLGVPVVQTLHNFRFFCMNGLMFRDGHPCERCLGGNPLSGAVLGCYQGSRPKSAMAAATLLTHRALGTWNRRITAFIALSEFSRDKYVAAGFPAGKMRVVRNGVVVPADGRTNSQRALSFLYLGRLSDEKGLPALLAADARYRKTGGTAPLVIAGDGPMADAAARHRTAHPGAPIRLEGRVDAARRTELLAEASHVLFPTACYENCPYVVLEALAAGLPVIASKIGGIPELVREGETGWLVPAGDAAALAGAMDRAGGLVGGWREMSAACRADALMRFSDGRWISEIEDVYRSVGGIRRGRATGAI